MPILCFEMHAFMLELNTAYVTLNVRVSITGLNEMHVIMFQSFSVIYSYNNVLLKEEYLHRGTLTGIR